MNKGDIRTFNTNNEEEKNNSARRKKHNDEEIHNTLRRNCRTKYTETNID